MNIIEAICTQNRCYKTSGALSPVGAVLHSVGCPQPLAKVFVDMWREDRSQYLTHYVLDDQGIYHTMPNNRRCWHVGSPGNSKWLGIEMCEPKQIKYTSGAKFTIPDKAAAQAYAKACYSNAVWLLAKLCKEYGWDPQTAILTHNEVTRRKLSNTDHVDPEHLWTGLGLGYTLAGLRNDVAAAMGKAPAEKPAAPAAPAPSTPTTTTKETRYTMELRNLKKGCDGEDVRALQILLIGRGYSCGSYGADGDFGSKTDEAVRAFQKAKGLSVDGIAGRNTMAALLGA